MPLLLFRRKMRQLYEIVEKLRALRQNLTLNKNAMHYFQDQKLGPQ